LLLAFVVMKLQILSDVHLEMGQTLETPVMAPHLALLGDIGNPWQPSYAAFMAEQSAKFETVFVVLGNHEYYGATLKGARAQARKVCNALPNVRLLCEEAVDVGEYRILGTTLWSRVDPLDAYEVSCSISDFRRIRGWSLCAHNEEHERCATWLNVALELAELDSSPAIVLTHFPITQRRTSHPRDAGGPFSSYFANDMDRLIGPPCVLFAHGHTHFSSSQVINGVPVVSNQYGYSAEERDGFFAGFVVEV
jgi:predicted phosphohydrolase